MLPRPLFLIVLLMAPSGVQAGTLRTTSHDKDIDRVREEVRVSAYNVLGDTPSVDPVALLSPDHWRFRTFGDVDPDLSTSMQIEGSVSENLSSWFTGAPDCVVAEDEPNHHEKPHAIIPNPRRLHCGVRHLHSGAPSTTERHPRWWRRQHGDLGRYHRGR